MKTLKIWWLTLGILGLKSGLWAQSDTLSLPLDTLPPVVVDQPMNQYLELDDYLEVWADSTGRVDLAEARQVQDFVPYDSLAESFPLPLEYRLWARFRVENQLGFAQKLWLRTGISDSVVRYHLLGDSIATARNGNYVPPSERSIALGQPIGLTLELPPQSSSEVYLSLNEKTGNGPSLNPGLWDYQTWYVSRVQGLSGFAIVAALFGGAVAILFAYNLIIFFSTRVRTYLYYALYLLALLMTFYFDGITNSFPLMGFEQDYLNGVLSLLGATTVSIWYLLFGRSLVETRQLTPRWDDALRLMIGVRAAFAVIAVLTQAIVRDGTLVNQLAGISLGWFGVEALFLLVYIIWLIRSRSTVAWFFIVGSVLVFGTGFLPILLRNYFGLEFLFEAGNLLLISVLLEILVFSLGIGYKMRKQQREKLETERALNRELSKINTAFGRFVPHEFISSLGYESVLDVKLGDQVEKEVTVLFSDIRGYTTLSEQMTPDENFRFLNSYLGRLGPVIQRHGGFVNQYYGDGIMALFLDAPRDAVAAAIEMQRELAAYNQERQAKGREPIRMGVGVHTGPLMMGIIGDTLRLEASVVADTVNTAARMEGLTKHYGVNLLLSEATWQRIREDREGRENRENGEAQRDREGREGREGREAEGAAPTFGVRLLGNVLVKGRKQPLRVYECYDGDAPEQRDRKGAIAAEFEAGLTAYWQGDFERALRAWESVWHGLPGDAPTRHYVTLAQQYRQQGTPEDWDGVEVMLMK